MIFDGPQAAGGGVMRFAALPCVVVVAGNYDATTTSYSADRAQVIREASVA